MQLKVTKPEEIEFTLTATFNLKNWRTIARALKGESYEWPTDLLMGDIRSMVEQAEKVFWPESED